LANGWTGGQYSVLRAALGAVLIACGMERFVFGLTPREAMAGLAVSALALLLAVGWQDRVAAVLLAGVWLATHGGFHEQGVQSIGLLAVLAFHAALPSAPYGSIAAAGRADPGGGWRFPAALFGTVWVLLLVGYLASGFARGVPATRAPRAGLRWAARVVELLFAPVALRPGLREWAWLAMLAAEIGFAIAIGPPPLGLGLLALHAMAFDPAWIPPRPARGRERLFYDGSCGLCHRAVRFVLAEDTRAAFRFAPLESEAFHAAVPEEERSALPDSVVLLTADGRALVRSEGVVYLLGRLGGLWRIAGAVLGLLPTPIRDAIYDAVAAVRYRLFARPVEACPVVPEVLRLRFDA
jgi:predicted DCC family thiol-disulfide oxidoreductase YuxK